MSANDRKVAKNGAGKGEKNLKDIFDFIRSALPWIAIGLFTACTRVMMQTQKEGKLPSRYLLTLSRIPVVCFLVLAILEMHHGSTSAGTVWMVLGICDAVIGFAYQKKKENRYL